MLVNWVPHCHLAILSSSGPWFIRIKGNYCVEVREEDLAVIDLMVARSLEPM